MTLHHESRTSNAPAFLILPKSYEGSFFMRSSAFTHGSITQKHREDPSGQHRRRVVQTYSSDKRTAEGEIYWAPRHVGQMTSHVSVGTTNEHAVLYV